MAERTTEDVVRGLKDDLIKAAVDHVNGDELAQITRDQHGVMEYRQLQILQAQASYLASISLSLNVLATIALRNEYAEIGLRLTMPE